MIMSLNGNNSPFLPIMELINLYYILSFFLSFIVMLCKKQVTLSIVNKTITAKTHNYA